MACNCIPIQTIKISSITSTDTGIVLIPTNTISSTDLINLFKYKLVIPCNLKADSNLPIFIQTELGNIPLLKSISGNSALPSDIRKMTYYLLVYGNKNSANEFGQFIINRGSLC